MPFAPGFILDLLRDVSMYGVYVRTIASSAVTMAVRLSRAYEEGFEGALRVGGAPRIESSVEDVYLQNRSYGTFRRYVIVNDFLSVPTVT